MLRPVRLAGIAASAETLRLRHWIRRTVGRAVIGVVALALMFGALLFAHIAAWFWLRDFLPTYLVALIFTAVDLLLAVLLALIATRSSPSEAEHAAVVVRDRALDGAVEALSLTALVAQLLELLLDLFLSPRSRK